MMVADVEATRVFGGAPYIENCVEQRVVSQREPFDTRYVVMYGATAGHLSGIMRAGSVRIWGSSRLSILLGFAGVPRRVGEL